MISDSELVEHTSTTEKIRVTVQVYKIYSKNNRVRTGRSFKNWLTLQAGIRQRIRVHRIRPRLDRSELNRGIMLHSRISKFKFRTSDLKAFRVRDDSWRRKLTKYMADCDKLIILCQVCTPLNPQQWPWCTYNNIGNMWSRGTYFFTKFTNRNSDFKWRSMLLFLVGGHKFPSSLKRSICAGKLSMCKRQSSKELVEMCLYTVYAEGLIRGWASNGGRSREHQGKGMR